MTMMDMEYLDDYPGTWPPGAALVLPCPLAGEGGLAGEALAGLGLRLLCGVPRAALTAPDGSVPWGREEDEPVFPYLLCQGERVLLAVELDNGPSAPRVEGLPVKRVSGEDFAQGQVDTLLRLARELARTGKTGAWCCAPQPLPDGLPELLEGQGMLERGPWGLLPTDYGVRSGLVRALEGGNWETLCTPRGLKRLTGLLSARPPQPDPDGPIPFRELLRRSQQGLGRSDLRGTRAVERVHTMPMDEFMYGFPDQLDRLREFLGSECGTYGQTAGAIYRLLHSGQEVLREMGGELMGLLAEPTLDDARIVAAARVGRRVTGSDPDHWPPRYCCRKDELPSAAPLTLERRVARLAGRRPGSMDMTFASQESFFRGAAQLAGSVYPLWRAAELRRSLNLRSGIRYVDLLSGAESYQQSGDNDCRRLGLRIYYLLLIEPFRLIQLRQS